MSALPATLATTYTSPTNATFTTTQTLPSIPVTPSTSFSVEAKTAYLSSLRTAILASQKEINRELTSRMEEDKTAAEAGGREATATLGGNGKDGKAGGKNGSKKRPYDEDKEEENYGEEVVPDGDVED